VSQLETSKAFRQDDGMANLDRKRLGNYVVARRMEIGIRDRRVLQKMTGTSDRTLGKVELGQSVNAATLGAVENALGWEPGSAERIMLGGEPVIKGESQPAPRKRPAYSDPVEQEIWQSIADVVITGDPEEDERIKKGMIRYARAAQEDEQRRVG
jgi:hypothetical protein